MSSWIQVMPVMFYCFYHMVDLQPAKASSTGLERLWETSAGSRQYTGTVCIRVSIGIHRLSYHKKVVDVSVWFKCAARLSPREKEA